MLTPARDGSGKFVSGAKSGNGATEVPDSTPPAEVGQSQQPGAAEPPSAAPDSPSLILPVEAPPARRRGRPRGSKTNKGQRRKWIRNPSHGPASPEAPQPAPAPDTRVLAAPDNDQRYMATAKMLVGTTTGGVAALLGPEWLITEEEERVFITNATFEYLKSIQLADIPPGWVLLGAVAMYALPRVQTESFRLKMQQLKERLARGRATPNRA